MDKFKTAVSLAREGKLGPAKELFLDLLIDEPNNTDLIYNLGMCYTDTGEPEKAIELLQRGVTLAPRFANAWVALGYAWAKIGDKEKAKQSLEKALEIEPDNPHAHRNLGGIYGNQGDWRKSAEHLKRTLESDLNDVRVLYGLGLAYFNLNDDDSAVPYLKLCLDRRPSPDLLKEARTMMDAIAERKLRALGSLSPRGPVLIEPVRAIMSQVRELTGKDFRFIEKTDLDSHAVVGMARRNTPEHVVFYKPAQEDIINHLIAHECGHILRLFKAPPEKRKVVATNGQTRAKALNEITGEVARIQDLPGGQALSELISMWYHGIVRQVDNQPADTMIEKWLYEDYPELRPFQALSLKKQMREALQALTEDVRRMTPAKVYDASCTMNYAYFKLLSDFTNLPLHAPFKSSNYRAQGEELYKLTRDGFENSYEGDMAMTDKWAEFLGLTGWVYWTDFEAILEDYAQSF